MAPPPSSRLPRAAALGGRPGWVVRPWVAERRRRPRAEGAGRGSEGCGWPWWLAAVPAARPPGGHHSSSYRPRPSGPGAGLSHGSAWYGLPTPVGLRQPGLRPWRPALRVWVLQARLTRPSCGQPQARSGGSTVHGAAATRLPGPEARLPGRPASPCTVLAAGRGLGSPAHSSTTVGPRQPGLRPWRPALPVCLLWAGLRRPCGPSHSHPYRAGSAGREGWPRPPGPGHRGLAAGAALPTAATRGRGRWLGPGYRSGQLRPGTSSTARGAGCGGRAAAARPSWLAPVPVPAARSGSATTHTTVGGAATPRAWCGRFARRWWVWCRGRTRVLQPYGARPAACGRGRGYRTGC